jgi:5-methylcytosine-specific restriction endonuclease McrA
LGRAVKTEEQKQKAREYARQWRKDNPDKCREYHQAYAKKYVDKERQRHKAKAKRERELHPNRMRERERKYRESHPNYNKNKTHQYRTKMKNSGVFLILPKELKKLNNQPCVNCGTKERLTIDHIIPIARGGRHSIGNLQSLCLFCNSSKNSKLITEWKYND